MAIPTTYNCFSEGTEDQQLWWILEAIELNTTDIVSAINSSSSDIVLGLEDVVSAVEDVTSAVNDNTAAVMLNAGFSIGAYDYTENTYVGSTNNLNTTVYKTGGASGTVVATLTYSYVGGAPIADNADLESVTKS